MPNWKKVITSGSSAQLNSLIIDGKNIDTTGVTRDQVLTFNGTDFVPTVPGYSFEFDIDTFNYTLGGTTHALETSTIQLMGTDDSVWKESNEIYFTATYDNGPPDSAEIEETFPHPDTVLDNWLSPFYEDYNAVAINYPNINFYRTFELSAEAGAGTKTNEKDGIYFYNYRYYGASSTSTTPDNNITGSLTANLDEGNSRFITNEYINPISGKYLFLMYRQGMGAIPYFDGTTSNYGFTFGTSTGNKIAIEFVLSTLICELTNTAGRTEDYRVYRSEHTVSDANGYLSTTTTPINYIYYGELAKDSSGDGANDYDQDDVKDNLASEISTQGGLVSNTLNSTELEVNCTDDEYGYFAYPARLGPVTSIVVGGFESINDFDIDADSGNELQIENEYGYIEDYYVYVSQAHSLINPTKFVVTI